MVDFLRELLGCDYSYCKGGPGPNGGGRSSSALVVWPHGAACSPALCRSACQVAIGDAPCLPSHRAGCEILGGRCDDASREEPVAPADVLAAAANAARGRTAAAPVFDPRDYDWCAPEDEDKPWESFPDVPVFRSLQEEDEELPVVSGAVMSLGVAGVRGSPLHTPTTQASSRAPLGICPICCDEAQALERPPFRCEGHDFCRDCVQRYLRERLASKAPPRCPVDGCGAEADPRRVQGFLTNKEFERFLVSNLLSAQRMYTCPSCSSNLCGDRLGTSASPSARCGRCATRFCLGCSLPWHSGKCETSRARHFRRQQRKESHNFREISRILGLKRCPQCLSACEKSDERACDHMTCARCRHEFCWLCLADRNVILAHGNHFHLMSCPHHHPYRGPAEFEPDCRRCIARGRPCTPPPQSRMAR
eukprot:TRINITY_DN15737_c0_g1_i1.p1 TRINITY_DN15737_c0_g1~~TRINITY_DN15737_c0_g1_i1.p1  ORF type:complete len:421 (-),score=77.93 TRINITY_DN15737_c0_g1_i1:309-1571(-)